MTSPVVPRPSALAEALDQLHKSGGTELRSGLLALQCQLVNARAGLLLPVAGDGSLGAAIARFAGGDDAIDAALAPAAADLWQRAGSAAVARLGADGALHLAIQPLAGDAPRLVAALAFDAPNAFVAALAQERLELTSRLPWAAERDAQASAAQARLARLVHVVETLASIDAQDGTTAAALALANETQARFGVERVAVGLARGGGVALEAVSQTAELSPQLGARRALEAPMQRAIDEDRDVALTADGDAAELGGRTLAVLPLRANGAPFGALALLHAQGHAPAAADLEAVRLVAELAAPRLADRMLRELAPGPRLRRIAGDRFARMQREGRAWRLGAWPAAALIALAIALFPAQRRIEAPFVIQPEQRRIVTAPFDAKIAASEVRPGDLVEAGRTVIAKLDTRELELELAALRARRATELQRADLARGEGDPSGEQKALLTAEQAAAEIRLLEHRIAAAQLVAPVTGVLLAGDLRQRIGTPVERGTVLAEVAPLAGLRAELSVPEDEVLDVAAGQRGTLATAARPGESIRFEVERVEPMAKLADGENTFRVLVALGAPEAGASLLPGMQGVAKIDAGRAPLAWQALRPVVNALRMWLWI